MQELGGTVRETAAREVGEETGAEVTGLITFAMRTSGHIVGQGIIRRVARCFVMCGDLYA